MKKKSGNATIHRIELKEGRFATISINVLKNPNLTEPAKVLLTLMLNNSESWNIVLVYYQKMLDWSKNKLADAVENLRVNGYLKKGEKGRRYYIISEYGNLKVEEEALKKETKNEKLKEKESSIVDEKLLEQLGTIINPYVSGLEDTDLREKILQHFFKLGDEDILTEEMLQPEPIKEVIIEILTQDFGDIIETQISKFPKANKTQREAILKRGFEKFVSSIMNGKQLSKKTFSASMLGVASEIADRKKVYKEYED